MENEITAQEDSTKTGEEALLSLAAALEAKDDISDKGGSDEETGEKGEKATEEENKTSEEGEATEEKRGTEERQKDEEEQLSEAAAENAELRSLLRDQKSQLALLKAKQGRLDKRTSKVIDEETGEETDLVEDLTPFETKMAAISELGEQRGASLEIMLEQMSDTKKWGDVKEVVTGGRVDGLIDLIAEEYTRKNGGDNTENRLDVELSIWSLPNPYKYLYDLIKEYHADYNTEGKKEKETETKTDTAEKAKVKNKEPVKANASIGDIKGGSDKGGWTSDKIDKIDELDLHTVPREVYNKYLRGELD